MEMRKSKVAIVGCGTVGSGVATLLLDFGDRTARHAGETLWLEKVLVRDPAKRRSCDLPKGVITTNLEDITTNPEIKAVAVLLGGLEPARTIMLKLLESGKDLVTANKAVIAEHGPELFDRSRELGRSIAFEATVAGGIPIVCAIGQCLSANQIVSLHAILNGTSNYILTQMEEAGLDYDKAVEEAKRLGFAEDDPTLDVDGTDTAQKLSILAHLAFGARVNWKEIPRQGIDVLDPRDLKFAKELGYRIKLLAIAELVAEGLELHVSPTLVRLGAPLAEVRGEYNAISVVGDAVGRVFFHGLGAGKMPTASAVVADLIDTVVGRTAITFRTLELWSKQDPRVSPRAHDLVEGRFYIRINVVDRPGVMAEVTGILGRYGVSIASVIQREVSNDQRDIVPLVIITHQTTEGASSQAFNEISRCRHVRPGGVKLRIRE